MSIDGTEIADAKSLKEVMLLGEQCLQTVVET